MSVETFERAAHWVTYLVAFALLYDAIYRLDGTEQMIALVAGAALMHTAGYIDGRRKHN